MRLVPTLLAAAAATIASLPVSAQMRAERVDRYYDREAPGADYDGGRYGPRGVGGIGGSGGGELDPWLSETAEGERFVLHVFDTDRDGRIKASAANRANTWFRRYADTNRDMRLTDAEIRIALVTVEKYAR